MNLPTFRITYHRSAKPLGRGKAPGGGKIVIMIGASGHRSHTLRRALNDTAGQRLSSATRGPGAAAGVSGVSGDDGGQLTSLRHTLTIRERPSSMRTMTTWQPVSSRDHLKTPAVAGRTGHREPQHEAS